MGVFRKAAVGAAAVAAIAVVGLLSEANGQGTSSLYNFIFGAPLATTPAGTTDYIPVTQGGVIRHIRASGLALSGPFFNPVADHGADPTGVADSSSAIETSINDCNASTLGGVIDIPTGTYKLLSNAGNITRSNCRIYAHNVIFTLSGTTAFSAITFTGTGLGATLTMNANVAQDANVVTTTTNTGLAVGGYMYFEKDAPANGGAAALYKYIAQIVGITGAGPYTISLSNSFPVAFATADAGLKVASWTPITNVGIDGALVIDATAHTTTQVFGISVQHAAFSTFNNIRGINTNPGLTFLANSGESSTGGFGNVFNNISAENGSDSANAGIWFNGETLSKYTNIRSSGGVNSGFGVQIQSNAYPSGANITSNGNGGQACGGCGRNIKIEATIGGTFTGLVGNSGADNGIALAVGSTRNTIAGCVANKNVLSEGIWLSDQYNTNNSFYGCQAHNNTTRDVYVGPTDTGNVFYGLEAEVIVNEGAASILRDNNGGFSINGPLAFTNGITCDGVLNTTSATVGLTVNGTNCGFTAVSPWNAFGSAVGSMASPTDLTTNIMMYHNSATNYNGWAADTSGRAYLVTGTSAPATRFACGTTGSSGCIVGAGATVPPDGTLNVATDIQDRGTAPTGTAASGYVRATSPTLIKPVLTDAINQETHILTTSWSNSGTTLSNLVGLSQSLTAAGLYSCNGHIHFTTAPTASNGVKIALATSDTLTVNTLSFTVIGYNGAAFMTTGTGTATALAATAIASTTAATDLHLSAAINVNAAGTLQVQMAENAASGTIASTAGNARWDCHRAG